jgi:hypothetical protein
MPAEMMGGINDLNSNISRIKNALTTKKYAALAPEDAFFNVYCYFMDHYGYIPFDDFIKMPLFLTLDILKVLEGQDEAQRKAHKGVGK